MATPFQINVDANLRLANGATDKLRSQVESNLRGLTAPVGVALDPRASAQAQGLARSFDAARTSAAALGVASGNVGTSLARLGSANASLSGSSRGVSSALLSQAAAAQRLALGLNQGVDAAENFGRRVALAGQRFVAFSLGAGALLSAVSALKSGVSEAIKFELQINKLRQVADEGEAAVGGLRDEILSLSKSLGVSSAELADGAVAFTQAGLKATEARVAIQTLAQAMLAPNFESSKQTTEGMIAVYQQFGKDVTKLKDQLGSMNAVAGAFAVEAGDLITAVQKAGGAFSTAGGSLDELLALMTAVRATTRESADSIATGLRSIFTYIQRTETTDALADLGVNLRYVRDEAIALGDANLEGQFVGPYRAVQRLSEALATLPRTDPRYASIVEDLGGVRQVSRVIPLIQQFGEAQKALNVARIGGASLDASTAVRQGALQTQLTKISETYQKLANEFTDSRGFRSFVELMGQAASVAERLLNALGPLIPVVGGLLLGKAFSGLGSFASGVRSPDQYAQTHISPLRALRRAGGGPVPGYGGGDRVPALLEGGEYVLRKEAVRALGHGGVAAMNRTGMMPVQTYAGGGPAGFGFGRLAGLGRVLVASGVMAASTLAPGLFANADEGLALARQRQTEQLREQQRRLAEEEARRRVVGFAGGSIVPPPGPKILSLPRLPRFYLDPDPGRSLVSLPLDLNTLGSARLRRELDTGTVEDRNRWRQSIMGAGGPHRPVFSPPMLSLGAGTKVNVESDRELLTGLSIQRAPYGVASVPTEQVKRFLAAFHGQEVSAPPRGFRPPPAFTALLGKQDANPSLLADFLYSAGGRGILSQLPADLKFLGAGVYSAAFSEGPGVVHRLTRRDLGERFAGRRPNVPEVLQADRTLTAGSLVAERLPRVTVAGDMLRRGELSPSQMEREADRLNHRLYRAGYRADDLHEENFGYLPGGRPVIFDTGFLTGTRGLKPQGFAKGGSLDDGREATGHVLRGGIAGKDSILAALMPGEFVLRKSAVDKIGPERVAFMNETGRIPGFAGGKLVGRPEDFAAATQRLGQLFPGEDPTKLLHRLLQKDVFGYLGRLEGNKGSVGSAYRTLAAAGRDTDAALRGFFAGVQKFEPDKRRSATPADLSKYLTGGPRAAIPQALKDVSRLQNIGLVTGGDPPDIKLNRVPALYRLLGLTKDGKTYGELSPGRREGLAGVFGRQLGLGRSEVGAALSAASSGVITQQEFAQTLARSAVGAGTGRGAVAGAFRIKPDTLDRLIGTPPTSTGQDVSLLAGSRQFQHDTQKRLSSDGTSIALRGNAPPVDASLRSAKFTGSNSSVDAKIDNENRLRALQQQFRGRLDAAQQARANAPLLAAKAAEKAALGQANLVSASSATVAPTRGTSALDLLRKAREKRAAQGATLGPLQVGGLANPTQDIRATPLPVVPTTPTAQQTAATGFVPPILARPVVPSAPPLRTDLVPPSEFRPPVAAATGPRPVVHRPRVSGTVSGGDFVLTGGATQSSGGGSKIPPPRPPAPPAAPPPPPPPGEDPRNQQGKSPSPIPIGGSQNPNLRSNVGSYGPAELPALLRKLGVGADAFIAKVRQAADASGKLAQYLGGASQAVVKVQNGAPQLLGFRDVAKTGNSADAKYQSGLLSGGGTPLRPPVGGTFGDQYSNLNRGAKGPINAHPLITPLAGPIGYGGGDGSTNSKFTSGLLNVSPKPPGFGATRPVSQRVGIADYAVRGTRDAQGNFVRLPGGYVDAAADAKTRAQIHHLGGPAAVSFQTQNEIRNTALAAEEAKARRDLTSAQRRLVDKLHPHASAVERGRLVQEAVNRVMTGQEQAVRNARGIPLGAASTVGQATAAGIQAPGPGGRWYDITNSRPFTAATNFLFGGGTSAAGPSVAPHIVGAPTGPPTGPAGGGLLPFLGTPFRKVWGNLSDPQRQFGAVFALSSAASYLGSQLTPSQERIRRAAETDQGYGAVRAQAGAGGFFQGAGIGAAVGLGLGGGPLGAAIGAAVGGLYGFVDALREAAKNINEARIARSLTGLQETIGRVAEGKANLSLVDQTKAIADIQKVRSGADYRARKSEPFLGYGFDAKEENKKYLKDLSEGKLGPRPVNPADTARATELKLAFQSQLPAFVGVLTQESQRIAKTNPTAKPVELANQLLNGINGEMLRIVADIRDIPLADVLREFAFTIRDFQHNIQAQRAIQLGQAQVDQAGASLGRVALGTANASLTASRINSERATASLAFGGSIVPVGNLTEGLSQFGAAHAGEFNRSNRLLSPLLGANFGAQSRATDQVARVLPGILSTLAASPPLEGQPLQQQAQKLFESQIKDSKTNPELIRAINVIVGGIAKLGADNGTPFNEAVRADPTKLAEDLLGPLASTLREYGQRAGRDIEGTLGTFVEGLAESRTRGLEVSEAQSRTLDARLIASRAAATLRSERLGGGDPNRFVGLPERLAPLANRQDSLLAGTGLASDDAAGIAARLATIRGRLDVTRQARDNAAGDPARFKVLAGQFDSLVGEASRLQSALRALAEPAQKAAILQERLNELNADRDNRLGYAERFVLASSDERVRMNRGQRLAAQLSENPDGFGALSEDNKRLALRSLREIGPSSFSNGQTGEGLLRQLLGGTGILNPKDEAERRGILGEQARTATTAVTAQEGLVQDLSTANGRFLEGLTKSFDFFFARLEQNRVAEEANLLKVLAGQNRSERGILTTRERNASILAKAGLTSTDDIKRAGALRSEIQEIFTGSLRRPQLVGKLDKERLNKEIENRLFELDTTNSYDYPSFLLRPFSGGPLPEDYEKGLRNPGFIGDFYAPDGDVEKYKRRDTILAQIIEKSGAAEGLNPTSLAVVSRTVQDKFQSRFQEKLRDGGIQGSDDTGRRRILQETVSELISEARIGNTNNDLMIINGQSQIYGDRLRKNSLNPELLKNFPDKASQDAFFKALDATTAGTSPLENLPNEINRNEEAFRKLSGAIDAATGKLNTLAGRQVGAVTYATGGSVFRPHGTDTVPAMLTPGEFVVNARAAKANSALLHLINSSRSSLASSPGSPLEPGGLPQAPPAIPKPPGKPAYLSVGGFINRAIRDKDPWNPRLFTPSGRYNPSAPIVGPFPSPPTNPWAPFPGIAPVGPPTQSPGVGLFGPPPKPGPGKPAPDFNANRPKPGPTAAENFFSPPAQPKGGVVFGRGEAMALVDPFGEVGNNRFLQGLRQRAPRRVVEGLFQREGGRQIGNLLEQQLYAGVDDEQYSGAVRRTAIQGQQQRELFLNQLSPILKEKADEAAKIARINAGVKKALFERKGHNVADINAGVHAAIFAPNLAARRGRPEPFVRKFADGGLVPGLGSADSVPSMLAPGEFVMTRQATKAIGAEALFAANKMASGGLVGGASSSSNGPLAIDSGKLTEALASFNAPAQSLASALSSFGASSDRLVSALEKFPTTVEHSHRITADVIINDGGALATLKDDQKEWVMAYVGGAIRTAFEQRFPESSGPVSSEF